MLRPLGLALCLLPHQCLEVHAPVELVGLSTRIADPPFLVERFCDLHDALTVHAQETTAAFLQLHGGERKRFPFACGLRLNLCDPGFLRYNTALEEDSRRHAIEEMTPGPPESHVDAILLVHDFNTPEVLGDKVADTEVSFDDEA